MSDRLTRRGFILGASGVLSGCGASLANFPFDTSYPKAPTLDIEVTFYGVGCSVITYDNISILTDPFWSYLPFRTVAFGTVLPDPKQVDQYLHQLSNVQAVVIGHNHYDHNMDLPYVAPHLHPDAVVLGAKTMVHTFAPNNMPIPMVSLNQHMATVEQTGTWWMHPSKKIRVLPILSGHPNQYLFFHLYRKRLETDRATVPTKVGHYQEGVTMAFLIDFLDPEQNIQRRVYVQTSSTGYPVGFFPQSILDEHPVEVALIAMDSANLEMKDRYTVLDFLRPSVVLFCHWEDFFRPKDQVPKEIVKVDLPKAREFFQNTEDTVYLFPRLDSTFQF